MFSPDRRMGPIEIERSTGKWRCSNTESAPSCPRCASSNTKFCYYNNYSHSQPRYFCKGCRRYWTKGGSLRNVPIGGGCRKRRRSRSARTVGTGAAPSRLAQGENTGAADIDLAAVFARYVGENEESSISIGGSSGSSENIPAESVPEIDDIAMFQFPLQNHQEPSDLINGADEHDLLQQVPELTIDGQDFVGGGYDLLQQGAMLADELGVFWSERTDFECQQMQDFSIFDVSENNNNNNNMSCDSNWGFFDFSAYEYFSRP